LRQHEVPLALFGVLDVPARLLGAGAMILSGRWIRRVGMSRALVISIVIPVAGLLVLGGVNHVAAFVGFGLVQFGTGLALPAISAYVNDRTESHVRATILSIAPLGSSLSFGIIGPVVGATGDASLQLAFVVMAVLIAIAAGAIFL